MHNKFIGCLESLYQKIKNIPFGLILGIITCVYILIFWWLSVLKYERFLIFTGDTAGLNQTFWTTIHGQFLQVTSWSFFYSTKGPISFFATHFSPFYILLIPFYALFPSVHTLFFLRTAFIGISAIPLYLIGRSEIGKLNGFLIALVFLAFPTVVHHINDGVYEIYFSLFFFFFSFYYFKNWNFKLFICFLVMTLFIKESMGLTTLIFGVYAAIKKRPVKWIVVPIGLSILWTLFAIKVAIPYYRRGLDVISSANWLKKASDLATNEGVSWLFNETYLRAFFQFLKPFLYILPFFCIEAMFVFPEIGIEKLVGSKMGNNHYSFMIAGILVLSLIYSIKNIQKWLENGQGKIKVPLISNIRGNMDGSIEMFTTGLISVFLLLSISYSYTIFNPTNYLQNPHYSAMKSAISIIPTDASVTVPDRYLAHVSNRFCLDYSHLSRYSGIGRKYEYYLIDTNRLNSTNYDLKVNSELNLLNQLKNKSEYKKVFDEDGIYIFKRIEDVSVCGRMSSIYQ